MSNATSRRAGFRVQKSRSPPIVELRKQLLDAETQDQADKLHGAFTNLFACPFAKRHPELVSRSCLSGWSSMARLKEHLHRKHQRPPICPRCQNEFRTVEDRNNHLRAPETCDVQYTAPDAENLWLSDKVYEMLSRRSKKGDDRTEEWKYIYTCIFEDSEPPSPYLRFPDDSQGQRQRAVRDFARALMDECHRTVDAAYANNRPPFLTIDDVAKITEGIIGEGFSVQDVDSSGTTDCSEATTDNERDVVEIDEKEYEWTRTLKDLRSTTTSGCDKKSLPLCQSNYAVPQKAPQQSSADLFTHLGPWTDVANDSIPSQACCTISNFPEVPCLADTYHARTLLFSENYPMSMELGTNPPVYSWEGMCDEPESLDEPWWHPPYADSQLGRQAPLSSFSCQSF